VGAACGLAVVLTLAGHLYGIKPDLAAYRELSREIDTASAKSEMTRVDPRVLAAAEANASKLRKNLAGDSWDIPLEQMESHVISKLDRISQRHSVQLQSVKPGVMSTVLMFEEHPYDIEVAGEYFTLADWFYDVEQELRPIATKQFSIEPESGGGKLRMALRLVAYRAKEQL